MGVVLFAAEGGWFALEGVSGLFAITVELLAIVLSWVLIKEVKWEAIFRHPRNARARMCQVLIAIVFGHAIAQFFLQYMDYTAMLRNFVE
ncbi:DUF1146 family protein [Paenibacillus sp. CAU 1782]